MESALTPEDKSLQEEACAYIATNKNKLINEFILKKNPLKVGFVTMFMAGSPGAGKTEFSQRYIPSLFDREYEIKEILKKEGVDTETIGTLFIRIDVDEIREFLPQYQKTNQNGDKGNAHVIQKAANKGLDILREYCLNNHISFLHDGTFGNYETMRTVIKKSLKDKRQIRIYYLYLDPVVAWNFTRARESLEGRNILKDKFIDQYFNSKSNVSKIKEEFKSDVHVTCILKDSNNQVLDVEINVPSVDNYMRLMYKKGLIKKYSREDLEEVLE